MATAYANCTTAGSSVWHYWANTCGTSTTAGNMDTWANTVTSATITSNCTTWTSWVTVGEGEAYVAPKPPTSEQIAEYEAARVRQVEADKVRVAAAAEAKAKARKLLVEN